VLFVEFVLLEGGITIVLFVVFVLLDGGITIVLSLVLFFVEFDGGTTIGVGRTIMV